METPDGRKFEPITCSTDKGSGEGNELLDPRLSFLKDLAKGVDRGSVRDVFEK